MKKTNINYVAPALLHEGTTAVSTLVSSPGRGSSLSYFNDGYIERGVEVPAHNHDEEELFYVLDGVGRLVVEEEEEDIVPGDAIYIPSRAMHSVTNTGTQPLRLVVVGLKPVDIPPEFRDRAVTHSSNELGAASGG